MAARDRLVGTGRNPDGMHLHSFQDTPETHINSCLCLLLLPLALAIPAALRSAVKRRVIVGDDGVMWRMQAGRRHKRYKKSRRRLLDLKGLVPLHKADATKLRKLGYKRRWWFVQKA